MIKKGIFLFIGITIAAFTVMYLYTNTGDVINVWREIRPIYLLLGLLIVANDLFLGGLRNHIFAREFVKGISQMVSIKANLANIFMGAVTPSQSGGGPAQFYIFYKNGVKVSDIITISIVNWISTLIYFPISGAIALYILEDQLPGGFVTHLTQFGFSVFTTLLVLMVVLLIFPTMAGSAISRLGTRIATRWPKRGTWLEGIGAKVGQTMTDLQARYVDLFRAKPQLLIYSFLLTIILYFNKYFLAYVILMAFGVEADFWTVTAIQAVLYLLLYFAPSPGGSGIAELTIGALMASVLSDDYLTTFTLLQRSFLFFIPALFGAWVVLNQIRKE